MGAARKKADDTWTPTSRRPATSREGRQSQLEAMAYDLAEKQLKNGDASSQVITHFLKSASTRGRIEELRLTHEIELMKAKKSQIESQEELQNMFKEAITAMGTVRYEEPGDDDEPPMHLRVVQ